MLLIELKSISNMRRYFIDFIVVDEKFGRFLHCKSLLPNLCVERHTTMHGRDYLEIITKYIWSWYS